MRIGACPGGIEQHQEDTVPTVGCSIDQLHNFLLVESGRQFLRHLGEDEIVEGEVAPLQSALVTSSL